MKKLLIFITIFFISSGIALAGTCWNGGYAGTAPWTVLDGEGGDPSCAQADVNYCVNSVAGVGDTVNVGAGTATWTTTTRHPRDTNSYACLPISKGVNLIGAGSDQTIITNGTTARLIIVAMTDEDTAQTVKIKGFGFTSASGPFLKIGYSYSAPFAIQKAIIGENTFTVTSGVGVKGNAIYDRGHYGVVYGNIFNGMYYPIARSGGNVNWWEFEPQNIFTYGSEYYMYYEDNEINFPSSGASYHIVTDGEYSPRYVYRYNDINTPGDTDSYLFELHGEQVTPMASAFGAEIYGNDWTSTNLTSEVSNFFKQRSGQTLVFYNNNSGGSRTPTMEGYTSSVCICPEDYASLKNTHNSYWFHNRKNLTGAFFSAAGTGGLDCNGLTDIPTMGRDIFSNVSTPGITAGTLANIPASCAVGQGYWATDQATDDLTGMVGVSPDTPISGELYKCTSTDTWTKIFEPYAYPHPLRFDAEMSGSLVGNLGLVETDIVAGGQSFTIELTGTTWVADVVSDGTKKAALVAGITGNSQDAHGWNVEVTITDVVRTSDTVVTMTLPASAGYDITTPEEVSVQIAAALNAANEVINATPNITIDIVTPAPPSGSAKASVGRGGSSAKGGALGTSSAAQITGN